MVNIPGCALPLAVTSVYVLTAVAEKSNGAAFIFQYVQKMNIVDWYVSRNNSYYLLHEHDS